MMASQTYNVLGLVFPGFNLLDLTGPIEVFGNSNIPIETRSLHIASATQVTKCYEGMSVQRDVSFEELESKGLGKYDLLLVPGAPPHFVLETIEKDHGFMRVVSEFAKLKNSQSKWLFSVCSGSFFLGAAGILGGRTATTHWSGLDTLDEICTKAGEKANIVQKRWIDAGRTQGGARIVTAGGVSCGLDGALWIASEQRGLEVATRVAKGMDYDWCFTKVEYSEGYII